MQVHIVQEAQTYQTLANLTHNIKPSHRKMCVFSFHFLLIIFQYFLWAEIVRFCKIPPSVISLRLMSLSVTVHFATNVPSPVRL